MVSMREQHVDGTIRESQSVVEWAMTVLFDCDGAQNFLDVHLVLCTYEEETLEIEPWCYLRVKYNVLHTIKMLELG